MNYRVQVLSADLDFAPSSDPGVRPGQFRRLKDCGDADGVVYVVDSDFNNFQMFMAEGETLMWAGELGSVPADAAAGRDCGGPAPAADRRRRAGNRRVQQFERRWFRR
jgi:hypothetical protein